MKYEFTSKRASFYKDVPDEKWNDWRWQLSNRLNTVQELVNVLDLNESEKEALRAKNLFRVDITPYFASLIDPNDPRDPIRQQVVPTAAEMVPFTSMMEDSLAEDAHSPVPGLVHR
jgi:lysine 2,3-aminomutase